MITCSELSRRMHISRERIRQLVSEGRIPVVRAPSGRRVWVTEDDAEKFARRHANQKAMMRKR
jgi:excisionase family DNA binding protein